VFERGLQSDGTPFQAFQNHALVRSHLSGRRSQRTAEGDTFGLGAEHGHRRFPS